jgi:hypothetical protein
VGRFGWLPKPAGELKNVLHSVQRRAPLTRPVRTDREVAIFTMDVAKPIKLSALRTLEARRTATPHRLDVLRRVKSGLVQRRELLLRPSRALSRAN